MNSKRTREDSSFERPTKMPSKNLNDGPNELKELSGDFVRKGDNDYKIDETALANPTDDSLQTARLNDEEERRSISVERLLLMVSQTVREVDELLEKTEPLIGNINKQKKSKLINMNKLLDEEEANRRATKKLFMDEESTSDIPIDGELRRSKRVRKTPG